MLLPENVWAHMMTFTDTATFYVLSTCCRALCNLARQPSIVQKRCERLGLPHGLYRNLATETLESWHNGLLHGPAETLDAGGNVTKIRHWHMDRLHGLEQSFYEDGRRWGVWWRNGQRDGLEYVLSAGGQLLLLQRWHNDQREGIACRWNDATLALEEYAEWRNGQKHGLEQVFENGVLLMQSFWKDGVPVGESLLFYPSGELRDAAFYDDSGALSGVRRVFFDAKTVKTLQRRVTYINGEKHGKDEAFFQDGKLQSVRTYEMGQLHGVAQAWDSEGHLREECSWTNGQPVGLHRHWHAGGGLSHYVPYKEGLPHGTAQKFYKHGSVAWLCHWENGLKEGDELRYYPDGGEWHKTHWERGHKHGVELEWINKTVVTETRWKRGLLHGKCANYFENGQLRSRGSFRHGIQEGKYKEWYISGQRRAVKHWIGGKQSSYSKSWYENGVLEKKTLWEADRKWGIQKHYFATSQLAAQTRWVAGEKEGYEVCWFIDGALSSCLPFVEGLLHGIGWTEDQVLLYFWYDTSVDREDFLKLLEGNFVYHPHSDDVLVPQENSKREGQASIEELQLDDSCLVPRAPVLVDWAKYEEN